MTVEVVPGEERWEIRVDAPLHGDPLPPGPAGPTAELWEYEVVELFLAGPGERYLEIELGPGGHHLVLRLEGNRQVVEERLPMDFQVRMSDHRWMGRAWVPTGWLPPGPWRTNAYAIHGVGSQRRYLAAFPVPGEAPDFHRLECMEALDGLY